LSKEVIWSWDSSLTDGFGVRMNVEDVYDSYNNKMISDFFSKWANQFVNTMRPKLKQIE